MAETAGKQALSPMAMPIGDVAKLLSKVSGKGVDSEMLEEDVAEGAPTNPDGTINLVNYAAWLVKEMAKRAN
ncbi:hypothetical protein [Schlesneria sp.]|uniref:hypothetical protein n=1 Tax=Schlesneria sp. TaxID=2762018 RepID=UPI002F0F1222